MPSVTRPTTRVTTSTVGHPTLAQQLPADWRAALADEIKKPYFKQLEAFVAAERQHGTVFPPPDQVFAALKRTPLSKVKVVLMGQDPYPTKGNAMGLSFSVARGQKVPASLRNIYKVLASDAHVTAPAHGDLGAWADRGVLLLNSVLTVREGEANSHRDHGWEQFTHAILELVNHKQKRVVFLCLGKSAQDSAAFVDTSRHAVVKTPHPSPLVAGNPFGKTHPFSEVNQLLHDAGEAPIDWQLPT